ncbi:MAG TPA: DUF4846 domain-containing protein [Puia sp.]|uniref:DUF4846 domain-containing protein n=1 Tax=Puia sp. TaxID=2045100 RepID=UPI002B8E80A7|nr:DUF4846 domain-containing protein [Puia sp.]HVU95564.1 DUF4846 domain-containing protein [Puia sp.]
MEFIPRLILSGMRTPILLSTLLLATACQSQSANPYPTIGAIPLPPGYHRLPAANSSFGAWLRNMPLKKDRTVYLFDGTPKRYQGAQFAVLDISVGKTDLQQCADAVMRLRAEYCYSKHDLAAIDFYTEQGVRLNFLEWSRHHPGSSRRASFDAYLTKVFMYCSTRTLEKQLHPKSPGSVNPGDVWIKGGAPGHATIVVDVAEDAAGHRIYLLAQSYMPAQDIHLVKNPADAGLSPWYTADTTRDILETPEWTFTTNQLRSWSSP